MNAKITILQPIFEALILFMTAGNEIVSIEQPSAPLSFYQFALPTTQTRSSNAVRNPGLFMVLEKCFQTGDDEMCISILKIVLEIYMKDKMNYFILEKHYPFYLFVDTMASKGSLVQHKVLEVVEFIMRSLNFIPCNELTAIKVHLREAFASGRFNQCNVYLKFLFGIIALNVHVKDAFRELLHLDEFIRMVQTGIQGPDEGDPEKKLTLQLALDLIVASTKGNVVNAQFVTENFEMSIIKTIFSSGDADLTNSTTTLIRHLLFLAKNEQLFSSLLQLLFSDPGNLPINMIILKIFVSALLESHKVRVMFRRSGGYICLMALFLHHENALVYTPNSDMETISENSLQILVYIAQIFKVLTISMRFEPSSAKHFLTEVIQTAIRGAIC
uniref:Uncharacterized protein n=1 Tax=Acrobeloides nanus TaxID=290746 RepID=A0A914D3K7_9BILA